MKVGVPHIAVAVAGCIPLVLIWLFILPVLRQSKEVKLDKTEELADLIQKQGIGIYRDKSCEKNVLGYYVPRDKSKAPSLVLCSNNLNINDRNALWDTLAHEATHAMQDCNGGNISDQQTFAFWEEQMEGHARASYKTSDGEYSRGQYKDEVEARMMERLPDWEVIEKFKKFCKST